MYLRIFDANLQMSRITQFLALFFLPETMWLRNPFYKFQVYKHVSVVRGVFLARNKMPRSALKLVPQN